MVQFDGLLKPKLICDLPVIFEIAPFEDINENFDYDERELLYQMIQKERGLLLLKAAAATAIPLQRQMTSQHSNSKLMEVNTSTESLIVGFRLTFLTKKTVTLVVEQVQQ